MHVEVNRAGHRLASSSLLYYSQAIAFDYENLMREHLKEHIREYFPVASILSGSSQLSQYYTTSDASRQTAVGLSVCRAQGGRHILMRRRWAFRGAQ
jgi:hypothetical protein